jgi:hypothetical protein
MFAECPSDKCGWAGSYRNTHRGHCPKCGRKVITDEPELDYRDVEEDDSFYEKREYEER